MKYDIINSHWLGYNTFYLFEVADRNDKRVKLYRFCKISTLIRVNMGMNLVVSEWT